LAAAAKEIHICPVRQGFLHERCYSQKKAGGTSAVQIYTRCANRFALRASRSCIMDEIGNSGTETNATANRMLKVKDTLRATVHLSFDGRVLKAYHGAGAEKRFANEVRVLRHLEARGCLFVPRLLEADEKKLQIMTTNCGARVEQLDKKRINELFAELEPFGVRHDDPDLRNITYRFSDGRFCLIDFEFATILPEPKTKPT
jgi:hypothetical protein